MKNARISKKHIGNNTYYYPQIQMQYLYFFKTWDSVGGVFIDQGRMLWFESLGTYEKALKTLRDYEELYGKKLNILNLK
ncbi:MAG TPA: hypothetical protein VNX68_14130 [Nitrosopumilaceae archaeon]|jgi:hypothetical protein|nr:hypothetical protein [Nitrosopumilaceae archaeon]